MAQPKTIFVHGSRCPQTSPGGQACEGIFWHRLAPGRGAYKWETIWFMKTLEGEYKYWFYLNSRHSMGGSGLWMMRNLPLQMKKETVQRVRWLIPGSIRELWDLKMRSPSLSFTLVITLVLYGVISVHWNRKLQEMSANVCQISQAKESFTTSLNCSFTALFLYQKDRIPHDFKKENTVQIFNGKQCRAKTDSSNSRIGQINGFHTWGSIINYYTLFQRRCCEGLVK